MDLLDAICKLLNQRMGIQIGSNGYLFSPPIGHSKGFFLLLMKGSCSISMTIFGRFLIKSFNYTFISLSALGSLQFPLIYRKMDALTAELIFLFRGCHYRSLTYFISELLSMILATLYITLQNLKSSDFHQHLQLGTFLSYYSWFLQHCT